MCGVGDVLPEDERGDEVLEILKGTQWLIMADISSDLYTALFLGMDHYLMLGIREIDFVFFLTYQF